MPSVVDIVVYKGEACRFRCRPEYPTPPVDITGWAIRFHISKRSGLSSSQTPLLLLSTGAGITIVGASVGEFDVQITSAQMLTLGAGEFVFDVWRADTGNETLLATGKFTIRVVARW